MTPSRSELFEAAVRAGCVADKTHGAARCEYPHERCTQFCGDFVETVRVILATLLPPDPAPETLSAMWHAYLTAEAEEEMRDAYRALRASLLPGEEPS